MQLDTTSRSKGISEKTPYWRNDLAHYSRGAKTKRQRRSGCGWDYWNTKFLYTDVQDIGNAAIKINESFESNSVWKETASSASGLAHHNNNNFMDNNSNLTI